MSSDLTREALKTRVFEFLRKNPSTQFENVVHFGLEQPLGRRLSHVESHLTLEIIHELITSNILMMAVDRANGGWPWFGLTTHGREVLSASGPPVYDYDGYLAHIRERVSGLDGTVERYLGEALRAYQHNLHFASLAMLGCASERSIWLLMGAYVEAISDPTNRDKLRSRISGRDVSTSYKRFRESFDSARSQMPPDVHAEFEVQVDAVFTFTRLLRNAIMHSTPLPPITPAMAYASLQQFSYYLPTIDRLVSHLRGHPITV